MIDLAYVQKEDHGEFLSEAGYVFWHGCHQMGIDTVSFRQPEIETLPLTKNTLVHGGIGMVRRALDRLGVPQPHVDGMPPQEVYHLYGRRMWATTMAEVRQGYEDNRFFFIKPLLSQKAFTGHVTSGSIADLSRTIAFENDFEVLASEVMSFQVEYRLFVHKSRVVAARFYCGDFTKQIDYRVADEFISLYKNPPVSYSLDLGLAEDGQTRVVEINDAFSLGCYGLSSIPYARLVIDRWEELVGL